MFVVKYFPVRGARIDQSVTGDWGAPLDETRRKTDRLTKEVIHALQEGSRRHGYKNPQARPSLWYRVVGEVEFLEPLPTVARPGHRAPLTDYRKVANRLNIRSLVDVQQVKEVWLWGYHGGVLDLWESNMASPVGDISNSLRWFVYWMQNVPGAENGLTYQGRPLTNWWCFIGDFDNAVKQNLRLVR